MHACSFVSALPSWGSQLCLGHHLLSTCPCSATHGPVPACAAAAFAAEAAPGHVPDQEQEARPQVPCGHFYHRWGHTLRAVHTCLCMRVWVRKCVYVHVFVPARVTVPGNAGLSDTDFHQAAVAPSSALMAPGISQLCAVCLRNTHGTWGPSAGMLCAMSPVSTKVGLHGWGGITPVRPPNGSGRRARFPWHTHPPAALLAGWLQAALGLLATRPGVHCWLRG